MKSRKFRKFLGIPDPYNPEGSDRIQVLGMEVVSHGMTHQLMITNLQKFIDMLYY